VDRTESRGVSEITSVAASGLSDFWRRRQLSFRREAGLRELRISSKHGRNAPNNVIDAILF
jgi:hypothetical protein